MAGSARTKLFKGSNSLLLSTRSISSQTLSRQSSIVSSHSSTNQFSIPEPDAVTRSPPSMPKPSPLSMLPLGSILRSLATMSISSSPILLRPSLVVMEKLANSRSTILSPDHNPLLRVLLKKTFYKQFCAGENEREVSRTVDELRHLGISGVVLAYAKEAGENGEVKSTGSAEAAEARIRNEIIPWRDGTLKSVRMTRPGDFVAMHFTGAGSQAIDDLTQRADPSPAVKEAIDSICELAAERGVKLLYDAEQAAVQPGIDAWTMKYQEKYNKDGKVVIYGTYQAYLKSAPAVLAGHLEAARKGGFTLGVKLVRGAYLGSDPRHLICDTKADTDAAYDGISEGLVCKSYNSILRPAIEASQQFPEISVVLAGHNIVSVRKVQALVTQQKKLGKTPVDLVYAQLQGMADEVSWELVLAGKDILAKGDERAAADVPRVYKYLSWGTTGECMKYLYRRAQENKDALGRTREGRDAMAGELWRRFKSVVGVSF